MHGDKAAGRDFRNHMRSCVEHLGFTACLADPDIWMRPATKSNGREHYEHVLSCTDYALQMSDEAEDIFRNQIGKHFAAKKGSISPPTRCLGAIVRKVQLDNMAEALAFSSSQCVRAATKNVENYLKKKGMSSPKSTDLPLPTCCRSELDVAPELSVEDVAYFQLLIGVLRRIVELVRVHVHLEASMMASCASLPRGGHLEILHRTFSHLKKHHVTEMVFGPSKPSINNNDFERKDWSCSEFSSSIKKDRELHPRTPTPRGVGFVIIRKVDADHAGDTIRRRSRTGFVVHLHSSPVC